MSAGAIRTLQIAASTAQLKPLLPTHQNQLVRYDFATGHYFPALVESSRF